MTGRLRFTYQAVVSLIIGIDIAGDGTSHQSGADRPRGCAILFVAEGFIRNPIMPLAMVKSNVLTSRVLFIVRLPNNFVTPRNLRPGVVNCTIDGWTAATVFITTILQCSQDSRFQLASLRFPYRYRELLVSTSGKCLSLVMDTGWQCLQ